MAKVLRDGSLKRATYTCERCNSLIEFDEQDVQECDVTGDWVTCPVCKKRIPASVLRWSH